MNDNEFAVLYAFTILSAISLGLLEERDLRYGIKIDLNNVVFITYVLSIAPLPDFGHPKRHDQYLALCLGPGD